MSLNDLLAKKTKDNYLDLDRKDSNRIKKQATSWLNQD